MKTNTDKWYDVYFLIDPFIMQVFYVGMSEDSIQRYLQHIQMKDGNTQKNERIAAIIAHGSLPLLYKWMKVQGTEGAYFYEALYTEVFLCCKQPLTNSVMKVNKRDEDYIKHRDLLIDYYKIMGLHVGGSFHQYMELITTEMPQDRIRKAAYDRVTQDLEERGCTVTTSEYKDLYGTHRKTDVVRPEKMLEKPLVKPEFTLRQFFTSILQKIGLRR